MRVVRGKKTEELSAVDLAERMQGYRLVAIDLGTGKGHFIYQLARSHPRTFCIGIEPVADNVARNAHRAGRKPSRGGLRNLLYVAASVEEPPPELEGIAHQLYILFPWGRLLRGLLQFDSPILEGITALCRPWARLEILINQSLFQPPVSRQVEALPQPGKDFIRTRLAPGYADWGLLVVESRNLILAGASAAELPGTLWARKLSGSRAPALYLRIRCRGRQQ